MVPAASAMMTVGHGQRGGPVGVDLGQVQAKLQLGRAGAVTGRGQDAELAGELVAGAWLGYA
jgi:hypothetical protein